MRTFTLPRSPTPQDSIKKFERELMLERHMILMKEKQVIVKRQQEEVRRLMHAQVGDLHRQVTDTWTVTAEAMARKRSLGAFGVVDGLRHLWP